MRPAWWVSSAQWGHWATFWLDFAPLALVGPLASVAGASLSAAGKPELEERIRKVLNQARQQLDEITG